MTTPDTDPHWVDEAAGPVVRPYAVTGGRAKPRNGHNVVALLLATRTAPPQEAWMAPEHAQIVDLCQRPIALAEVAANLGLPLGTVRVLLDGLLDRGLVRVSEPREAAALPDNSVFEALINGLRAL
ncbi:Protein of unknown function [Micromonospora phaseoli]|uniref:DUF742 domain-containing protein n=1 Tax=Micromonospora phaseoli TaxID=1144548 RepID=A0A1H6WHG9_9ACTN|nr:DUF742 domain-containing protein [Micromonospora phaseoli]PZW01662.1 uncharacterized protein DUF742 [Micromonospora phaseoli]GIJ80689.1 hypothetical protein Xph01_51210 [Micromonospora phaseoli]SEJ12250.1 Protein of unknown function [Micromonospora phaseoli]